MKRLLLDSHALLWWLADSPSLGPASRDAIGDMGNDVYVSAASTWEIAIKRALGKVTAPDDLDALVEAERFIKLPISLYHGDLVGSLPPLHRDPFDRMLVAQAQAEGLIVVTADSVIAGYGVRTIDAAT